MKERRMPWSGLLAAGALAFGVLGLVAGFVPEAEGPFVRARLSMKVLRAEPAPEHPYTGGEGWRMRGAVARPGETAPEAEAVASGGASDMSAAQAAPADSPVISDLFALAGGGASRFRAVPSVGFSPTGVTVPTADGHRPVDALGDAAPLVLLPPDGAMNGSNARKAGGRWSEPTLVAEPAFYGEALDQSGRPVRWSRGGDTARLLARECAATRRSAVAGVRRPAYGGPGREALAASPEQMLLRARQYRDMVERNARRYNLSPRLVLAIMQAESGFNPNAVSPAQALGLMQIVPGTAGGEVHAYLYGSPGQPQRDALFDPGTNIRYGTVYLHLLANRHFSDIVNPATRELCVIAAYNGGPNALLRVFDPDRDRAVTIINSMTTQQVYETLVRRMPADESRKYVDKVLVSLESLAAAQ